jgi:excinuclease UvrABC nuclease subunit
MSIYKQGRPNKYDPNAQTGKKPPIEPGEYRIRDTEGAIVYIGETCNLLRRMLQHILSGKLSRNRTFEYKSADKRSTSKTRRIHERDKIKQHGPALNKSAGGEGRPAMK